MVELDKITQEKIDKIIDDSDMIYNDGNGDIPKAIELLKKAWEELPSDTKFQYDDSFHIANFITVLSMEVEDYVTAKEWAFITQKCNPSRGDIGEKEFLIGQVAYAAGDMDEAYKYLKLADEVSNGLCFQEENPKYKKLARSKA